MSRSILVVIFLFNTFILFGQTVYKTPSGKKYHTSTCRYVKNVSNSLSVNEAKRMGLSACTQCRATLKNESKYSTGLGIRANEAKGESHKSSQCRGKTKAGLRCKRMTKNVNGFCFQHEN
ncbi:hypothetical protein [Empedobacter brevis]|uniref:hypothetical protein n=1 Tax=Empedobacter brevis TaxID=247 RepID=UPI002FE2BB3D